MINRIVFCTLRDNKGATGGPGGVLYLQKTTLGDRINGIPCEYWFNSISKGPVRRLRNEIVFFFKALFSKNTYFFTHDVVSGAILGLLGKRYSLVFHHQGPVNEERRNLGGAPSDKTIERINAFCEKKAFLKAETLHFPANGAADMYFNSKFANCTREQVNVLPALYNIIPQVDPETPQDFPLKADDSKVTLFSLGTLTVAKGQDLTVEFIDKYINAFKKPIRYIMVGKGPLKVELLNKLDSIKTKNPSFEYHYFEGVPHDTVMYIHKISDIYIMLHRISIFDFATLEAMSQKSAVILSKVGGNADFNKNNNIIYAEDVYADDSILADANIPALQKANFEMFNTYFTKNAFLKQYQDFFKIQTNK